MKHCPLCEEEYEGRLALHLQDKHSPKSVEKRISDLLNYE